MTKRAVIALKLADALPAFEADYIGADKGALVLADKGIRMAFAVGDFDSVTPREYERIAAACSEVIRLNPVKDDSDSEHAVNEALKRGYDEIWLCGALGGRADHMLVNLRLACRYAGKVWILDERNRIHAVAAGRYVLKRGNYSYISFFTDEEAVISLEGLKYGLQKRKISVRDLYTVSNEWTAEEAVLTVFSGTVLIMESRD